MSELDDKLREISLYPDKYYDTFSLSDEDIAQIKRAFAEAGWVYAPFNPLATDEDPVSLQKLVNAEHGLMTGAEWYQRFEKEFNPTDTDCAEFYVGEAPDGCPPDEHYRRSGRFEVEMEAHEAAKKASGI